MSFLRKITYTIITLSMLSCATSAKSAKSQKMISPAEMECVQSCEVIAKCSAESGSAYSHHESTACVIQCLDTEEKLRRAVVGCSISVYAKDCNRIKMSFCVQAFLQTNP